MNLHWLTTNRWLGVTGLFEAAATFGAIYAVTQWFGSTPFISLALAALGMATSPAEILRVTNEQSKSGQVTERILHLSACNCVLAVIAFNLVVMFGVPETLGALLQASIDTLLMLIGSVLLGSIFGVVLPIILKRLGNVAQDATITFAFAVILLVALAHATKLSAVLAALIFGLVTRHRRVALSHTKKNFDALGNLLTVVLFVFVATVLEWHRVVAGIGLGLAIVASRLAAKTLITTLFAPLSGITIRKGIFTGMGLAPISVFVILTLEQTRYAGIASVDALTTLESLAAALLMMEIIGPVITQWAIIFASESREEVE